MNQVQQLLTDNIGLWTGADTAKKSGRGRTSGSAGTVYGIKKLRELILELAVRGKLVPQEASDEPASALLGRIQAEKARLVVEGKIKKDKPMAAIAEDEKPFVLPQGWEWVRFSDYATEITTGPFGSIIHQTDYINGGVPLINPSHMIDDRISHDSAVSVSKAMAKILDSYVLCDGDIVMARRGEVGRIALVTSDENGWLCGTGSFVLRFCNEIFRDYLRVFFRCNSARTYLVGESVGTTMVNLNHGILKKMPMGVPPLEEQHRIVAKVDELMALCDQLETGHVDAADAHEKLLIHLLATLTASQDSADFNAAWQRIAAHFDMLFTTEASIDALKQTLLQLAVMGKLVPQDPNNEPASALLERIQAEKAMLVAEGKIKKDKPLAAIGDDEKPFALPSTWGWARMGDICRPISSGSTPPADKFQYEDGVPFLKVYNIRNQNIDFEYQKQFIGEDYHSSKSKRSIIYPGDVVMNIVGPPLGKVAIIPNDYLEWNCNQAIVFFGIIKPMNNGYILNFLKEGSFLNGIELIGTAGQDNISVTKSKNIPVPVPPLLEQTRIVAKVDELMALCDRIKQRIVDAGALQRNLADAMVAQAVA